MDVHQSPSQPAPEFPPLPVKLPGPGWERRLMDLGSEPQPATPEERERWRVELLAIIALQLGDLIHTIRPLLDHPLLRRFR